jgi:signal transduction histidine kinase
MKIIIVIKRLAFVLLLLLGAEARAEYSDHRNRKVDSLEHVLRSGQQMNDEQLIRLHTDLMWGYLQTDGQRAETNAWKVLALSYEHDWLKSRADALRLLGMMAYGDERYDESIAYYEWALAVTDSMRTSGKYKETDIDDNLSTLYGSIGNLYNIQDKNLLAIEYYQKAMPIFEKYGWRESLTILHHNIAELYLVIGNSEEAERHYRSAIEQGRTTGDSLMMALPLKGLVKIYIDRDDYQRAQQTIQPAYIYYQAHRDEEPGDYAEVLAALTRMNLMSGHEDLTQAKAYAREALDVVNDEMMIETRCDVFAAAAMVEMKAKNWRTALQYALQSIHENDEEATFSDVGSYELLANIYMQLGNKEEASRYIRKVRILMEQFSTQNYQSSISQMEVLYNTEKKQKLIEQLNREKQWHLWGGILLSASLLLLALAFFLLWRSVRLQRRSALFKARFDGEVDERRRIARDLHDGLGGMLTMLRLKIEGDASKSELLKQLGDTATELRRVAHHLMPEQLLKNGLTVSLQDLAISVPGAHFSHFGSNDRLSQDLEVVLYRCAYELVNNAIKHAHADRIDIQLMQEDGQVTLTVSDNGRGLETESQQGGIGLQNIRERISHYQGTMHIVSGKEQGTETNIILPI